jgi:hypothetical protein
MVVRRKLASTKRSLEKRDRNKKAVPLEEENQVGLGRIRSKNLSGVGYASDSLYCGSGGSAGSERSSSSSSCSSTSYIDSTPQTVMLMSSMDVINASFE